MSTTAPGTAPLPEIVVKTLGRIAVCGLLVGGALITLALVQPGKVDASIVAVIGAYLAIVTGASGALGAILASVRTVDPGPPGSVTVTPSTATDSTTSGVTVTAATTDPEPTVTVAPARKRTPRRR